MAKVFLESGESFTAASSPTEIFGLGGGGKETVSILAGITGVVVDANIEAVELSGKVEDFAYKQVGTSIEVYSNGVLVAKIPIQEDGSELAFADGTVAVQLVPTATGVTLELGGTLVTTAETAAAVVPTAIDATVTSSVATATAKETVFSIDLASATLAEGNTGTQTVSFTVTRDGDATTADTVTVDTSGSASSGSDYVALANTSVAFAIGETTQNVTLTINGDTDRELDETLIVTLSNPSKGNLDTAKSAATLTITNDDANLFPTITVPSSGNAFIGKISPVAGFAVADADDSILTVTVTAAGTSQVSVSGIDTGASVSNTASSATLAANASASSITITGVKSAVSSTLDKLQYISNATVPGTETLTIKVEDPLGASKTETLSLNIGQSSDLEVAGTTIETLTGSSGNDVFNGTLANFNISDVLDGGDGTGDKLALTAVSGALPVSSTAAKGIEILDITTTTGGARTVTLDGDNFNNELTQVNFTDADTTADDTTLTVNDFKDGGIITLNDSLSTALVVDVKDDDTGTADDVTVNLVGGITLADLQVAADLEAVTVNSGGTSVNTVTDFNAVETVTITGAQDFSTGAITAGNAIGTFDGSAATGKLTINLSAHTTAIVIKGGTGNDSITGGNAVDTITGGQGNDTIAGGTGNDTITGGQGVDSITGGDGADTFIFAAGDTGSTTATGDVLTDLVEADSVKFTHSGFTFADGDTLKTSATDATVAEIYIDAANKQIVIETSADGSTKEVINIPLSATKASFTYDSATDAFVVGAAPLSATNDEVGTLTVVGKAIGGAAIVVQQSSTTTLNTATIGVNAVREINVSDITGVGATITNNGTFVAGTDDVTIVGSSLGDTITLGGGNDTITGGEGVDNITGGVGVDTIVLTETSLVIDTVVVNHSANVDVITGFSSGGGGDELDISLTFLGDGNTDGSSDNIIDGAGLAAAATTFVDLGASATATAGDVTIEEMALDGVAGIVTAASGTDFVVLTGNTVGNVAALADLFEVGGDVELAVNAANDAVGSGFFVVYSDGANAFFAAVFANAQSADDGNFEAGDLTAVNLVNLGVNPSIAASEYTAANFDFIT